MQTPSVTQVLGPFQDFSRVPEDVLDHAAWRGSLVHRICACIARGVPYLGEIPGECAGYVLSFQYWFRIAVERVHVVEQEFKDPDLGFIGHPDLIVTIRGDGSMLTLVDLKTPATGHPTWRGQLAAYRHLARKANYPVERVFSLRLDRDGKPPRMTEYRDDKRDFAAFLAALTAHRYFANGA